MDPESTNTREYDTPRPSLVRRTLRFLGRFSIPLIIVFSIGSYELGRSAVYREHPELSGQDQASAILAKVGALTPLPSGEAPTIATINDAASAKSAQPFLTNAENGDVLIVYPNALTAFLYRPSTNMVIAVGPVDMNVGNQMTAQAPTPEPFATTTDEARNTNF